MILRINFKDLPGKLLRFLNHLFRMCLFFKNVFI